MELTQTPEYLNDYPPPVRFGPGPDDHIAHAWAEKMLTQLRQENPRVFGKLLQAAALNEQS